MKEPLYKALASQIRKEIRSGTYRSGDKLPSKRVLAAEKKLSLMTVTGALELLEAEGYIYTEERRGYFVADGINAVNIPNMPPEVNFEPDKDKLNFRTANTAVEGFPFYTWAKLMRETLSEKSEKLLCAIDPKGVYELRVEIARQLRLLRGIDCEPRQIIIGAGTEYLIGLIYQLLGKKNYAFESPGYTKAAKIYSHMGAKLSFIPTDSEGIRADVISKLGNVDVVHTTPSHSFPLGIVTSPKRRHELSEWVKQNDRYIVEDDFDSEFRYDSRNYASIFSLDKSGRVIYMNTFTRTLAPSMRIGYMVLPLSLVEKFESEFMFYSSTVPALEQYVLAKFISDGSFERHLSRMRKIYRHRRDIIIDEFAELEDYVEILGVEAGVHILLKLKNGVCEKQAIEYARARGIIVAGISEYIPDGAVNDFGEAVVVNFAGRSEEEIIKACKLIKEK